MEAWAINRPAPDRGPSVLVCARLLGYMIMHAPIHEGRDNISNEISSCHNFQEMVIAACKYIDHFVRCCECGLKDIIILLLISSHASKPQLDLLKALLPLQAHTLLGRRSATWRTHSDT